MALGGRALDGTETSWGRPAEPAPRWRALLDRARLGGRTAEQAEADRHAEEAPRAAPEPLPRRTSGNGYAGRAAAIGPPGEQSYAAEPGYPAEPARGGYRAGASYRVDPAYRIDPAYQPEPPGYQQPEPPAYPADPLGYQPEPSGYPQEPTYPAEPSWRSAPGRLDPEPVRRADPPPPAQSRYSLLDGGGYRPEPPPVESRYSLLDSGGYRPEQAYQPPPADPVYQPPVVEPAYQPPPAEPAYRAEAAYPPVAEPVYQPPPGPPAVVERGYPARIEWRAQSAESELERAAGVLRRDLGTPRVLAFANPKGGVHKTTATVLAAATVGSVRGRGVLAWDDNELRGTLGLRAGSARHARTIRHLIHDLAQIEILEGSALLGSLDDYLRHAADGSYDVLAGEESPRFAQRLDQFTVKRVLELLRRTHDVVCVDTGNNVESPNWRTVMQAADQLVVTTVPREDAAFSADWMLDLLHEVGMGELADNAVTLISCPTPGRSPLQTDLERHFATRTRAVAVVPYDPALETGSSIEYHQLQPETRQAWLRAASVMLEPFAR
ncbi:MULTISPECIES: AAA family ATPase [unclassified Micromonospora]|uniref:MinD/ParA family ATP-binding protein n=1 Tax=unclassified Micromonospora TaxID=2617518 RepID=UPI00098D5461|nr:MULTISPECIES: AAA family ATPase [unclassified Micromonospora]OON28753.1 ATPase [Micromonospora sp. Rc5]